VLLAILLICPLKAIARLGPPVPFPELRDILEPSPLYPCVVLPILCIALVVLFVLYLRSDFAEAGGVKRLVWIGIVTTASGLWLFWGLPSIYRSFHDIFVEMEVEPMDLPVRFWPPIIATASILWGTVLLSLWFLLQPIVLQSLGRSLRGKSARKAPLWPLFVFTAAFTAWLILALFRPLIVLK
jgi:hypothetical protein